jgi:hypothetical protein
MARYYLHLHECGTVLEDLEGSECASLAEAVHVATVNARDVMMGEVRNGRLCLDCFISIADEKAQEVGRVLFHEAVSLSGTRGNASKPNQS